MAKIVYEIQWLDILKFIKQKFIKLEIKFISFVDLIVIVNNVSVTSDFDNPPKPLYVFRKR